MSIEINVINQIVQIDETSEIVEIVTSGGIGPAGVGVPIGGTTGQVLAKNSNTNYDTEWIDSSSEVYWGEVSGTLSNQTDLQDALDAKVPYTGATTNVDLGEFELKAGQVEFDQSPTGTAGVGVMRWNDSDGTLDLGLKGGNVTLQVGQEQILRVVNKTGADLLESQYKAVRIRLASEGGTQGQRLAVVLAQGNNDANSTDTIGIVTETITNNQEGFICTSGIIRGINTTGSLQGETWADGDIIYLSPTTAGAITIVKPTAPQHSVILGYVIYAHNVNGKIFVKCDNGYEIGELHDVYAPTPSNNDGIFWNSTNSRYENKTIASALGFTPVPTTRTLTINGTAFDLSSDRSWTISGTNIYTASGTLTSARALTLGGFNLDFIGSSFTNRFTSAGRLLLGTTTESTNILDVNGTARVSGEFRMKSNQMTWGTDFVSNGIVLYDGGSSTNRIGIGVTSAGGLALFSRVNSLWLSATNDAASMTTSNSQLQLTNTKIEGIVPFVKNSVGNTIMFDGGVTTNRYGFGLIGSNDGTAIFSGSLNPTILFGIGFDGTNMTKSNATMWMSTTSLQIGTNTEPASSILTLASTTKGFLPPRMTSTQRDAIASPATGLVVYNTTLNSTDTYDGARWRTDADTTITNRQTSSYSLVLADRGKLVEMNSASANTLTIPLNSSIAFPIGTKIDVTQYGAGATTITATGGVTIRSFTSFLKLAGQYAACTLVKIGTDEWYCYGNLIA